MNAKERNSVWMLRIKISLIVCVEKHEIRVHVETRVCYCRYLRSFSMCMHLGILLMKLLNSELIVIGESEFGKRKYFFSQNFLMQSCAGTFVLSAFMTLLESVYHLEDCHACIYILLYDSIVFIFSCMILGNKLST